MKFNVKLYMHCCSFRRSSVNLPGKLAGLDRQWVLCLALDRPSSHIIAIKFDQRYVQTLAGFMSFVIQVVSKFIKLLQYSCYNINTLLKLNYAYH